MNYKTTTVEKSCLLVLVICMLRQKDIGLQYTQRSCWKAQRMTGCRLYIRLHCICRDKEKDVTVECLHNDTIRYDTRCYFNVRWKADMSQFIYQRAGDSYVPAQWPAALPWDECQTIRSLPVCAEQPWWLFCHGSSGWGKTSSDQLIGSMVLSRPACPS